MSPLKTVNMNTVYMSYVDIGQIAGGSGSQIISEGKDKNAQKYG